MDGPDPIEPITDRPTRPIEATDEPETPKDSIKRVSDRAQVLGGAAASAASGQAAQIRRGDVVEDEDEKRKVAGADPLQPAGAIGEENEGERRHRRDLLTRALREDVGADGTLNDDGTAHHEGDGKQDHDGKKEATPEA